jgi:hypothetical protein
MGCRRLCVEIWAEPLMLADRAAGLRCELPLLVPAGNTDSNEVGSDHDFQHHARTAVARAIG